LIVDRVTRVIAFAFAEEGVDFLLDAELGRVPGIHLARGDVLDLKGTPSVAEFFQIDLGDNVLADIGPTGRHNKLPSPFVLFADTLTVTVCVLPRSPGDAVIYGPSLQATAPIHLTCWTLVTTTPHRKSTGTRAFPFYCRQRKPLCRRHRVCPGHTRGSWSRRCGTSSRPRVHLTKKFCACKLESAVARIGATLGNEIGLRPQPASVDVTDAGCPVDVPCFGREQDAGRVFHAGVVVLSHQRIRP
jgi:hypothetical protein